MEAFFHLGSFIIFFLILIVKILIHPLFHIFILFILVSIPAFLLLHGVELTIDKVRKYSDENRT